MTTIEQRCAVRRALGEEVGRGTVTLSRLHTYATELYTLWTADPQRPAVPTQLGSYTLVAFRADGSRVYRRGHTYTPLTDTFTFTDAEFAHSLRG